jgi:hypothetical protein
MMFAANAFLMVYGIIEKVRAFPINHIAAFADYSGMPSARAARG